MSQQDSKVQTGGKLIGQAPDSRGHFGVYGGKFVAETLMVPLQELQDAYRASRGLRVGDKATFLAGDAGNQPAPVHLFDPAGGGTEHNARHLHGLPDPDRRIGIFAGFSRLRRR